LSNIEQELKINRKRETSKNVSENEPRPENHMSKNNVQTVHDGMNLKNIKLDALTFDGQLNPQVFLDCTSDMDHYFVWYDMSDERKI